MPAERYFHPELLKTDQIINVKDQELHHLINVMRTRLGERLEVVNGQGQLAEATLQTIEKKNASLHVESVETNTLPNQRLILAQGMPRQNRLEFIIEKGTELGMTEIWLFPASRSEKKDFSANQLERLNTLTIAAMKQCGRLFLPKIVVMPPLKQWKSPDIGHIFFGDTHPDALPFLSTWKKFAPCDQAIFCIGPESGFAPEEIAVLQKLQAHGVKLHPNILRTDTAAIAALTLLSHFIYYPNN